MLHTPQPCEGGDVVPRAAQLQEQERDHAGWRPAAGTTQCQADGRILDVAGAALVGSGHMTPLPRAQG